MDQQLLAVPPPVPQQQPPQQQGGDGKSGISNDQSSMLIYDASNPQGSRGSAADMDLSS